MLDIAALSPASGIVHAPSSRWPRPLDQHVLMKLFQATYQIDNWVTASLKSGDYRGNQVKHAPLE